VDLLIVLKVITIIVMFKVDVLIYVSRPGRFENGQFIHKYIRSLWKHKPEDKTQQAQC